MSYLHNTNECRSINFKDIKKSTFKDALLYKVLYYVQNGWPRVRSSSELKPFLLEGTK